MRVHLDQLFRNDRRDRQPREPFVVGGHNVPGRVGRAGVAEDIFKRFYVFAPIFALLDVGRVELPVLFGRVDPFKLLLALLFL